MAGNRTVGAPVLRGVSVPMEIEEIVVAPPAPGEVRVRLIAAGVCHSCLHAIDGTLSPTPMPIVLGDEGSGVVDDVGPGVNGLEQGDHVVLSWAPGCGSCRECLRGRPARCTQRPEFGYIRGSETRFLRAGEAIYHYGPATFSPYTVVPARAAVRIDTEIPLEQAALVGCATSTGAGAVLHTASVVAGMSVVVIGCGGVGLNAVHAAHLAGALPIVAVDPVKLKLEAARRLGATETVVPLGDGTAAAIREASGGGADAVIVAVGSTSAIEQGVDALAPGGTCVIVGAPPTGAMLSIDPHLLRTGEKSLVGCSYGSCNPPLDFPKFLELYRSGRFDLDYMVSRRYKLSEINEAFDNLATGRDLRGIIVFDGTDGWH